MEQDPLRVAWVTRANQATLSLDGDIQPSNAPALIERFAEAVQSQPAHLDVDLSRLCSTHSVGLSIFVTAHFQCLDAGIQLRFLNPSLTIRELLGATGLDQLLSIADADALVGA